VPLGVWILTTAMLLGALWWVAAPPRLGGSTSFVIVDGTSMLPRLQRNDLVVLRASGSYRAGDVVGYRSSLLHRVVLHRIVAIEHGRFTFKGDNNGFVDPERPTGPSLVGKVWLRVPGAGRVVDSLRVPWIVGALAALLVLALGLGGGGREAPGSGGDG
jgi:signal peptidase I